MHHGASNHSMQNLTFLNVSLLHTIFPEPWIVTDCCVNRVNITYICCNSIGKRYQFVSQSLWLNVSNRLVIISPSKQQAKIPKKAHNNINNVVVISMGFGTCSDFQVQRKIKNKFKEKLSPEFKRILSMKIKIKPFACGILTVSCK